MSAAQTAPRHGLQNVRTLVSCALLAAVSVVLARFIIPMPNEASEQGDILVGRIRPDSSDPSGKSLCLFVAATDARR